MEIADALYGVTMRSGVTQVISQRLNRADETSGLTASRRSGSGTRRRRSLIDFDGVLRRWDPAVAAGVEREYGLADRACSARSPCTGGGCSRCSPARSATPSG